MPALNHSRLESHDCRCCYRTGEIPVLLAAALSAALALVYPEISHSEVMTVAQDGQGGTEYFKSIDDTASVMTEYLKP
jgi:hypothetical protein